EDYVTAAPKVLEYNVRFGDPETQSILVRLESDLVEICEAMLAGQTVRASGSAAGGEDSVSGSVAGKGLRDVTIRWSPGNSACVVLASEGYPQKPRTGDVILGLDDAAAVNGVTIFHAGTTRDDDSDYLTSGGRVLGVTAVGDTLDSALTNAYRAAETISWPGLQYRRDIGK
ncbi:MAG TPA: phosphoribosylglycinamide synthetase C domain-containing protein, partial [Pyrinomonadaceae bacterium]|nr:phosphoribosylglycinamide synthetase C domain-containing protein [Pyrinomonadaceae bacterium]